VGTPEFVASHLEVPGTPGTYDYPLKWGGSVGPNP
jgi:hypothetical protein